MNQEGRRPTIWGVWGSEPPQRREEREEKRREEKRRERREERREMCV
jgi:hypothetical protein